MYSKMWMSASFFFNFLFFFCFYRRNTQSRERRCFSFLLFFLLLSACLFYLSTKKRERKRIKKRAKKEKNRSVSFTLDWRFGCRLISWGFFFFSFLFFFALSESPRSVRRFGFAIRSARFRRPTNRWRAISLRPRRPPPTPNPAKLGLKKNTQEKPSKTR